MNTNDDTAKWFMLFCALADWAGYSEDDILDCCMEVLRLPRHEHTRAYQRGIEAILRAATT